MTTEATQDAPTDADHRPADVGLSHSGDLMQFGSVCSGIEAASVAFAPLGWRAAWLAEIEPFPCAVLAYHYPQVPNLGDMTTIARRVLTGEVSAPDVLCGGTPCQAFSVAGLRRSLADERGNLSLKFVELADAIDHVRVGRGEDECIVFWENVPGVLSTKDNSFGCFLGGLAGEDGPLEPPGGKWANAGAVYGPARAIAWRTLDAQYFGLAQRRRRVFVVASARKGFDPASVLFEWDGVRRDSAPSRESGKVAPTIPSRSTGGGGLWTDFDCDGGVVQVCPTLRAGGNRTGGDRPPGTDVDTADSLIPVAFNAHQDPDHWRDRTGPLDTDGSTQAVSYAIQAGALRTNPASGPDGVGVQADHAYTLEARAEVQAVAVSLRGREGGATAELGDEVGNCLRASSGGGDKPHVLAPLAFGGNNQSGPIEVATARNACASGSGRMDFETETFLVQPAHTLLRKPNCSHAADKETYVVNTLRGEGFDASEDGTGRGTPLVPVAFSCKDYGADAGEVAPTLRSMGHDKSHANAGGQVAIAFKARQDPDHWHDRTGPLDTDGGTQAVAFAENSRSEVRLEGGDGQRCGALSAGGGKAGQGVPMALQCSLPETLYNKGFNAMEEGNASTQETYPGALLRTLRQEAGEEAFAKWGLGILDSLQQAEVLRQALHGIGIRPATFSRSWVVCCALGFPVHGSGWLLQSLREAGCERCSSQGWQPSEQLAGELGAYLSELSRPGAQAARFMRDLWFASEGFGLLQQALLAVQEVGRPASRKGQSVLRGSAGRGVEIPENVSSARMQCEAPRERVLREACAAGEARDYWNGATEQERSGKGWVGEAPLAVRRLTVEECEFLQGFPRGYTAIPWRGKPADQCPDGPRYKALGNSWAVPNVAWIGSRIDAEVRRTA